jgi:hypothetical protein
VVHTSQEKQVFPPRLNSSYLKCVTSFIMEVIMPEISKKVSQKRWCDKDRAPCPAQSTPAPHAPGGLDRQETAQKHRRGAHTAAAAVPACMEPRSSLCFFQQLVLYDLFLGLPFFLFSSLLCTIISYLSSFAGILLSLFCDLFFQLFCNHNGHLLSILHCLGSLVP